MAKKSSYKLGDVGRPPEKEPWCWITKELMLSDAWGGQSIHCRRLIDFLMQEHMAHAGTENGYLAAPYNQLVAFGIGRRFISEAIKEAEARRLIEVVRGGKRNQVSDHISRYRLTWYATRTRDQTGTYYVAPTNEWKSTTAEQMQKLLAAHKVRKRQRLQKKQNSGSPLVNSNGAPVVNSFGIPRVNLNDGKVPPRAVHPG